MKNSSRDLIVGLFLLVGLGAVGYLSLSFGGLGQTKGGLELYASFDEIGGLKKRASVKIGGVDVGQVIEIDLDDEFRAKVKLDVDGELQLPDDSSAAIYTQGLLGSQYIALEPGASEQMFQQGAEIDYTQNATVLERILGKFVQNLGGS